LLINNRVINRFSLFLVTLYAMWVKISSFFHCKWTIVCWEGKSRKLTYRFYTGVQKNQLPVKVHSYEPGQSNSLFNNRHSRFSVL